MRKAAYTILLALVVAGAFLAGSWHNQQGTVKSSAAPVRKILYYVDPMHPAYKSDKPGIAPDCGMELVPVYEDGSMGGTGAIPASMPPGTVNVSPEKQQMIGVRIGRAEKATWTQSLRVVGRIATDETRIYRINSAVDGWIRDTYPNSVGSLVKKDEKLASFYAPEFLAAQQAYLYALGAMDRFVPSGKETPEQITLTRSNIQQYKDTLRNLGMSDIQIEEIARTRQYTENIHVIAPVTGFVLTRNVSPGQRFEKGIELYKIADLSRVWILADVFGKEAQHLLPGVNAHVSLPDQDRTFQAKVSNVLPQFDGATRTLKVRLETENPGYVLRPDMFVDLELPISLPSTVAVPVDAIVDSGIKKTVFVDRGEGTFEPREVETGWRHGDRVGVVKGLMEGERIVVSGTFLLDSESRMKAAAAETNVHARAPATGAGGPMTPVARAFALAKDPICGMDVDIAKAAAAGMTAEYHGKSYYFCTIDCKQQFIKDPKRYAQAANAGRPNP